MSEGRRFFRAVAALKKEAMKAPDTPYRKGYIDALNEIMWWTEEEFDMEGEEG